MGGGQHVLLTGPPGVGKSTLVQKVVRLLKDNSGGNLRVSGFYTREVRENGNGRRVGFEVVTLKGTTGVLASVQSKSNCRVGQYGVEVKEFENVALPAINPEGAVDVLVIDEIGKMELFSGAFKAAVDKAFAASSGPNVILATLPVPKEKRIEFVEKIRKFPGAKLICSVPI